jgi:hypothetical protein
MYKFLSMHWKNADNSKYRNIAGRRWFLQNSKASNLSNSKLNIEKGFRKEQNRY